MTVFNDAAVSHKLDDYKDSYKNYIDMEDKLLASKPKELNRHERRKYNKLGDTNGYSRN